MLLGDAAYQAGQLLGFVVLALVVVGSIKTLSRSDLTLREKLLGENKEAAAQEGGAPEQEDG